MAAEDLQELLHCLEPVVRSRGPACQSADRSAPPRCCRCCTALSSLLRALQELDGGWAGYKLARRLQARLAAGLGAEVRTEVGRAGPALTAQTMQVAHTQYGALQ